MFSQKKDALVLYIGKEESTIIRSAIRLNAISYMPLTVKQFKECLLSYGRNLPHYKKSCDKILTFINDAKDHFIILFSTMPDLKRLCSFSRVMIKGENKDISYHKVCTNREYKNGYCLYHSHVKCNICNKQAKEACLGCGAPLCGDVDCDALHKKDHKVLFGAKNVL